MNRRTLGFALLAAVLLAISPLAVVAINDAALAAPSTAQGTVTAPASSTPNEPTVAALTNPATTIAATEQAAGTSNLDSYLSQLDPSYVASVWSALYDQNGKALAQLVPALNPNCGTGGGWCIGTGIAGVALAACAVTAAPTLGLGCAIAGIAVLGIGIYELWFGQSAASQVGKQVEDLTETLVDDIDSMYQLAALGVVNQLSALNATVNALGYEAAAAALSQLGNTSFNEPLDLAQAGIAAQLGEALAAQMATITQLTGQFEATMSAELGSANSESYSCSAGVAGIDNPLDGSGNAIPCPSSAPSSYTYNNGQLSDGIVYGPTATTYLWLNASSPITTQGGSSGQTITFHPLDGGTPWYNVTLTGSYQTVNFTGPSGGYSAVWSVGASAEFFAAISFPLSSADFPHFATSTLEQFVLDNGGTNLGVWAGAAAVSIDGISCSSAFYTCGSIAGDTAGAQASVFAPQYLFTLANAAATQAETYWITLRDLGYTSASQVPARCLIPSPAQLLPQDLTPTQLASLNETAMLRIYYALLANLAYTFNASSTITAFNVCGHHVTVPTGSSPIGFGTYAYGYLYVPNATGWLPPSGGTVVTHDLTSVTTSVTSVTSLTSNSFSIAKKQVELVVLYALAGQPSVTGGVDAAGNTLTLLYQDPSTGGGDTRIYVDNQTTAASGSDSVTAGWTSGVGLIAVYTYNGTGVGPHAWASSTFDNPTPAELQKTGSFTVPSGSVTTAAMLQYTAITNSTWPSGATREYSVGAGTKLAVNSTDLALGAGSHTVAFGVYGPSSFTLVLAWSVVGSASVGPQAGPEVYASPDTWNYSGIISFAPAIGAWSPLIGESWLLPDQNPSFATVQPFTSNVTDPATGYGYVTTNGPTICATGGGGTPANCSLTTSPLFVLDYIGGNSSANLGITGSAYPTHEDGSGAGYSVYITECFTAQAGATVNNVTYTPTTTGACSFNHNTINSTVYHVCSDGVYVINISSCPTPPPVLVLSTNGCGGPYLSWLAGPIASGIQAIPFLGGTLGCDIAIGIAVVLLIVLVVLAVYVITWVVRAARGR